MRTFLVLIRLPNPRLEHGAIKARLECIATGALQIISLGDKSVAYLLTTALPNEELHMDRILLNEDSYLFVQVGPYVSGERMSSALAWLGQHHFQK